MQADTKCDEEFNVLRIALLFCDLISFEVTFLPLPPNKTHLEEVEV